MPRRVYSAKTCKRRTQSCDKIIFAMEVLQYLFSWWDLISSLIYRHKTTVINVIRQKAAAKSINAAHT